MEPHDEGTHACSLIDRGPPKGALSSFEPPKPYASRLILPTASGELSRQHLPDSGSKPSSPSMPSSTRSTMHLSGGAGGGALSGFMSNDDLARMGARPGSFTSSHSPLAPNGGPRSATPSSPVGSTRSVRSTGLSSQSSRVRAMSQPPSVSGLTQMGQGALAGPLTGPVPPPLSPAHRSPGSALVTSPKGPAALAGGAWRAAGTFQSAALGSQFVSMSLDELAVAAGGTGRISGGSGSSDGPGVGAGAGADAAQPRLRAGGKDLLTSAALHASSSSNGRGGAGQQLSLAAAEALSLGGYKAAKAAADACSVAAAPGSSRGSSEDGSGASSRSELDSDSDSEDKALSPTAQAARGRRPPGSKAALSPKHALRSPLAVGIGPPVGRRSITRRAAAGRGDGEGPLSFGDLGLDSMGQCMHQWDEEPSRR